MILNILFVWPKRKLHVQLSCSNDEIVIVGCYITEVDPWGKLFVCVVILWRRFHVSGCYTMLYVGCLLVLYWTCFLHHQSSTVNMKGAGSFKMLFIAYQTVSGHAPEDCNLHFYFWEDFRSSYCDFTQALYGLQISWLLCQTHEHSFQPRKREINSWKLWA